LAGEINTAMPAHVVGELMNLLNDRGRALKGARVLVLGVAYKPNVGDPRESPGLTLIDLLQERGADVAYSDPFVPALPRTRKFDLGLKSTQITKESLAGFDAVLIATAHDAFDYPFIVQHAKLILDTRNATKNVQAGREKIFKA
jgi:UDP-N-acetyl-D-glucosamine dehydrogenase